MPGTLAYIALVSWPFFILYFLFKKGLCKGILLSLFISYLFLPANFDIDLPGVPALDKGSLTALIILFFLILTRNGLGFKDFDFKTKFVFFLLLLSPFLTAMNNSNSYLHLPGVTLYDGFSQSINIFLCMIPFLLGFKYFRTFEKQVFIFKILIVFCLFYSIFILYEIRMSPQLHNYIYGYFPHVFNQQIRGDGFRAVVFVGHGLLLAFLLAIVFLSSLVFYKTKTLIYKNTSFNIIIVFFFFLVLILSKSYMPLFLAIIGALLILYFSEKMIFLLCFSIVSLYIAYPILSSNDLFPHQMLVNSASFFSDERAQSINFRFVNESLLLDHANEKPLLGWGGWGRNRIYDPDTFKDLSVTDGGWIISLGINGWLGFLAEFYFFIISIFGSYKAFKYLSRLGSSKNNQPNFKNEKFFLAFHALIVSFILIDQLPNASLSYFYWFFIGSLFGRSYYILNYNRIN